MAAEQRIVNGNDGAHQSYGQADPYVDSQDVNASAGSVAHDVEMGSGAGTATPAENSNANKSPSKDEIGWYFVESYYTTLSKRPDTLHLYYNPRSQFVYGLETEKVDVHVGQKAIQSKIKELDFQDCKVRVSNVDSQESNKSIVVMVIGEISNKATAHRKFTQTFVLATQPNGYYVLNDLFRYLLEDEEESLENGAIAGETTNSVPAAEPEPETLTSSADPIQQQHDVEEVRKKLEAEVLQRTPSSDELPSTGAVADEDATTDAADVSYREEPAVEAEEKEDAEKEEASAAITEEIQPEKPRDPEPTPATSPPQPVKANPVEDIVPPVVSAPSKPAAPKTWANLVAANRIAAPAVPNSAPSATSTNPAQSKAAPTTNRSVTPPTSAGDESPAKLQQNGNSGWQMAGSDGNKKQGRQHAQSISGGQGNIMAYVKNVTDKVDASILKSTLLQYGKLPYFDVSRQKNCAFVEFEDQAAYNAAVAANPHSIGGEQIYVEERRPRQNAYGGNFGGRGGMRGGRGGNEGRPGSQGRGGFTKDGGRGGFTPRGRPGTMTPKGRGQPQAA